MSECGKENTFNMEDVAIDQPLYVAMVVDNGCGQTVIIKNVRTTKNLPSVNTDQRNPVWCDQRDSGLRLSGVMTRRR